MREWIDRAEALALLGVKAQTLYAYVSRRQIEVRRETTGARRSLYRAEDVALLAERAATSRKASAIAAGSLAWGEPSIVTHVSTIQRGRLIYRNKDAVQLAATSTLEDVARLLWNCADVSSIGVPISRGANPFEALARLVPHCPPSAGRDKNLLSQDSCTAIGCIAAAFGIGPGTTPLHEGLASAWSLGKEYAEMLRRALVLVADHELNASTFAVRVAASTGAPISACLLAGLTTLSGPRHGGATTALISMLHAAERIGVKEASQTWLRTTGSMPGFGHPLYPNGDIRAIAIGQMLEPDNLMQDLADHVQETTGILPNIDFGLVAFARRASLPAHAPFSIFLLGRSIGWAAHALEQAQQRTLIRPRARYEDGGPP